MPDPGSSLKSQMRRADRLSAKYVLIVGDEEIESGSLKWKKLADSTQGDVPISDIESFFLGCCR